MSLRYLYKCPQLMIHRLTVAMVSRITINLKKEARYVPEEASAFAEHNSLHPTVTFGNTNGHSRRFSQGGTYGPGFSRQSQITFSSNRAARDCEFGTMFGLEELEENLEGEEESLWPKECASAGGLSSSPSDTFNLPTPKSSHSQYSRLSHHRYSNSQSYRKSQSLRNQRRRSCTTSSSSGLPPSPHFPWPTTPDNVHFVDVEPATNANDQDAHESYEMDEIDGRSRIIGDQNTESIEWKNFSNDIV